MTKRSLILVSILTISTLLLTATAALAQGEEPPQENPVIQFLSRLTGLSPEEILAQKESGWSLGNVARSYLFAELTGLDPEEVNGESHGRGWGVMFKNAGLHPGGGGRGLGWMIGKGHNQEGGHGRPDHAGGRPEWAGGPPPWAHGGDDDPDD